MRSLEQAIKILKYMVGLHTLSLRDIQWFKDIIGRFSELQLDPRIFGVFENIDSNFSKSKTEFNHNDEILKVCNWYTDNYTNFKYFAIALLKIFSIYIRFWVWFFTLSNKNTSFSNLLGLEI